MKKYDDEIYKIMENNKKILEIWKEIKKYLLKINLLFCFYG